MTGFHIELHGRLSELADSHSVDIDTGEPEVYGDDLKAQLAVILGARNPKNADDIRTTIQQAVWTTKQSILPDDTKLPQGHYDLRSDVSSEQRS